MTLQGKFTSMSMADLIQWSRAARRTGLLTVHNDSTDEQRKVFLDNGSITACSSNSPREYYGNYLIRLGYCTDDDIAKAMKIQRETGIMLGEILVMVEQITREQAVQTLEEKSLDNLCDVFLWKDGSFRYDPGPPAVGKLVEIHLDPISVVFEGVRRAEQWSQIQARIYVENIFERAGKDLPEDSKWQGRKLAQILLPAIDGATTVGAIIESLPFSRFQIMSVMGELVERGIICSADVTAIRDRQNRLSLKLKEARDASSQGNWIEAVHVLEGLAAGHPDRQEITAELNAALVGFSGSVYKTIFSPGDVPVVVVGADALTRLKLSPADGFILSRIDGRLTVSEILRISPIKELDLLRSLRRLLEAKVIDFPVRKTRAVTGH